LEAEIFSTFSFVKPSPADLKKSINYKIGHNLPIVGGERGRGEREVVQIKVQKNIFLKFEKKVKKLQKLPESCSKRPLFWYLHKLSPRYAPSERLLVVYFEL
jgi:hypothetical protein